MSKRDVTERDIWHKAIDLLARREYSQGELSQKLRLMADDELVDGVLSKLEEEGYQSDRRFTESFIRMRVGQGHGLIRVKFDLNRKGISNTLLSEILEEMDLNWYAQAKELYARKYSSPLERGDFKAKAKRIRFMGQRGYSMDEIKYAMEQEGEE